MRYIALKVFSFKLSTHLSIKVQIIQRDKGQNVLRSFKESFAFTGLNERMLKLQVLVIQKGRSMIMDFKPLFF